MWFCDKGPCDGGLVAAASNILNTTASWKSLSDMQMVRGGLLHSATKSY